MIDIDVARNRFERESQSPDLQVLETEYLKPEMRFALGILERWAMVSAEPNGEDSAGRQCLKLMDEKVLVDRAFKIPRLAFAYGRSNGLTVVLPTMEEMRKQLEEA